MIGSANEWTNMKQIKSEKNEDTVMSSTPELTQKKEGTHP
jgi:hypothetical protein